MELVDKIKENGSKNLKQFIKFGIVGISNTVISLAVYYLFLWISHSLYLVGSIAGFIVSVANSFYWNNKYVFETKGQANWFHRLLKTYVAYGGTAILATVLLWLEVDIMHWSDVLMPIVNLLITIPLNYIVNKLWAFKKKSNTVS